jgi:hypothetical protein
MRAAIHAAALMLTLVFAANRPAAAAGGEVVLKGKMVCGKCTLNETKECSNVLLVDAKGKQTKYYLTDNVISKRNHDAVCSGEAPATVTGTVKTAKGKKMVTASKITFD